LCFLNQLLAFTEQAAQEEPNGPQQVKELINHRPASASHAPDDVHEGAHQGEQERDKRGRTGSLDGKANARANKSGNYGNQQKISHCTTPSLDFETRWVVK
jgi:hypothetical protein